MSFKWVVEGENKLKDLFLCQCTLRQMIAHTSAEEAQEQERAQIALAEKQAKEFQDRKHRRDNLLHIPLTLVTTLCCLNISMCLV